MVLVIGFAELLGATLLLVSAVSGASFADVITGKAAQKYRQNATAAAAGGATTSTGQIPTNAGGYINPLAHATNFSRTDEGVDANLPVGAPILAPGMVKILGVIQDWYQGQPFIYFQLLDGPDAGKVQYVAEQIDNLAPVGKILNQGDTIANYAASGTGIEYGWGTANGQTLARATTGYVEGEVTAAGTAIRSWLKATGAAV
jgi:hypothetical protein